MKKEQEEAKATDLVYFRAALDQSLLVGENAIDP